MTQLWKSQMNQGMAPQAWSMNRSLDVDIALWPYEIQGSKAHVEMLVHVGLLSQDQGRQLQTELDGIAGEFQAETVQITESDEDIHGLIERLLTDRLGAWASMIHMGRSRNEQVLLDEKLYLIDMAAGFKQQLAGCVAHLQQLARDAGDQVIPSYTHLRRAQPILLRQYWTAHATLWTQACDDLDHFLTRITQVSPMGSGAINGTTLPTDPAFEAEILGFREAPTSPLAMISTRADATRFAAIWTHWMLDVSRLMEDLILWSSAEFNMIGFQSSVTSGSSMMPQKRNPDICELLRGKSAIVMGYYSGLMALSKGLPMGYMKDLQEDKTLLLPLVGEIQQVLAVMPVLLDAIQLNPEVMNQAVSDPMLLATDVMEVLMTQGTPMREAHHQVANCIAESLDTGADFKVLAHQRWSLPNDVFDAAISSQKRAKNFESAP